MIGIELGLLTDLKYAYGYAAEIDTFLKKTTPGAIREIAAGLRYYEICQTCLSDIKLVNETVDGLALANR